MGMIDNIQKLYGTIPVPVRHKVSLNVLFAEKSEIGDGIKKEVKTRFPKDYYNTAYDTQLFKKRLFYKIICIKQML